MDVITIIGEAEIDIRAVGQNFQADLNRQVPPALNTAGKEADKTARGMRSSFGAVWTAFGTQSQGALGPVATVVSQIQTAVESIQKNSSIAAKGMVAGGIGAGLGIGLQALGSGELAAQQQLKMSIENLGETYDDYDGQVEKTIKTGEKHGKTAEDTLRVLNQLTIATKSPAKALADYSIVLDMAAVRHVPLQTAARMLSMVYAGNSRALKTFGIDLTQGNKALAASKTATESHTKAQEALKKARQGLADTEARINASRQGHKSTQDELASATARVASAEGAVAVARFKHGQASPQAAAAEARLTAAEEHLNKVRDAGHGTTALTVSQQIELRKAHEAVTEAEKNVKKSATDMATAHQQAAGAVTSADGAVRLLADRVRGQADPAMNTFSGHLHQYWATAEDDLAHFGNKWGGTVTAISTGVLATSTVLEGGRAIFSRFASSGADAASTVEKDMSSMASSSQISMGRMAGAVAGVALAIGTYEVGKATASQGAKGGAETSLMGAVSGAAIGLSVGGPMGAAIGGIAGALAGLATHFWEAGQNAKDFQKKVDDLTTSLQQALAADKGLAGAAVQQTITSYLQKNPEFAHQLSTYGVSMNDLMGYAKTGKESKGLEAAFGAADAGKFGGKKGREDFINNINALMQAYMTAAGTQGDIGAITGNGGKGTYNRQFPGMPPGWHPPMALPAGYQGPGSGLAGATSGQLTSIHTTLLAIQHNTAKGTQATKDVHATIKHNGTVQIGRSPELATL